MPNMYNLKTHSLSYPLGSMVHADPSQCNSTKRQDPQMLKKTIVSYSADKSGVPQYQWYKESYEKLRKVMQMHAICVVNLKLFFQVQWK